MRQRGILSCFDTQLASHQGVLDQETQKWHAMGLWG